MRSSFLIKDKLTSVILTLSVHVVMRFTFNFTPIDMKLQMTCTFILFPVMISVFQSPLIELQSLQFCGIKAHWTLNFNKKAIFNCTKMLKAVLILYEMLHIKLESGLKK